MIPALKKFAKKQAGLVLGQLGYVALRKQHLDTYPLAKHLSKLFELHQIDCVFDIGANVGQYGTLLRDEVGFKGIIVSVEPVAEHAEQLRILAARDGNWMVRQVALGANPGNLAINVTRSGDFSSFLVSDNSQVGAYAAQNEMVRTEQVEVTTFDALLAWTRTNGATSRNLYLKLDTQGYDLEVLKGAKQSLAEVRALQTEMSVQPIYQGMPDYRAALDEIDELGFGISGIFPISLDKHMKLIEFECVMVRRDT
jgi:FkbM family methyltransferase